MIQRIITTNAPSGQIVLIVIGTIMP